MTKKFGAGNEPFLATNGDVAKGAPEELTRPTNQAFNTFYQTGKSIVEIAGNTLTPADGTNENPAQVGESVVKIAREQIGSYVTTTGTAGNYAVTLTPAPTSLVAGLCLCVVFNASSNSESTINVNGLGEKTLKQYDATGAKVAAVTAANQVADVLYDGTDWVILDPLPISQETVTSVSDATFSDNSTKPSSTSWVRGAIDLDRPYEAAAINIKMNGAQSVGLLNTVARGDHVHPTDTSRAPLASPALTGVPTAPTAAVGTSTTQIANMAAVQAEFGARKFVSQNFTLSSQSVVSVSHSLGVVPSDIVLFAKFKTATSIFAVGDVVCLGSGWFDDDAAGNNYGFSLVASASSIKLIVGSNGITVHNGGGSASATSLQTTCDFFFVATI